MSHDARLRLFVALYPPPGAVAAMFESMSELDLPPGRATPRDMVHLTLQFIGDRSARELEEVHESVERSAAGVRGFTLTSQRLITLPGRGPARLIACETDAPPELLEMQRRLAHRLARSPREQISDRFLPHLTLLRFNAPGPLRIDHPLQGPAFRIEAVLLMRSILRPQGAVHAEVARFPLLS